MRSAISKIVFKTGVAAILLLGPAPEIRADFPQHPNADKYEKAADLLASAWTAGSDLTDAAVRKQWKDRIDAAAALLPSDSYLGQRLRECARRLSTSDEVSGVAAELAALVENLRFEPIAEAELPEGFPAPTPVGEVELKKYPAYRSATTENGPLAFWRLFNHIKKASVEMTTPVEMQYGADVRRPIRMAFLYEGLAQGKTGQDGAVTVRDAPELIVLSTGVRGSRSDAALERARLRVDEWLERHADRFEPAGSPRVLGYNSPFVPRESSYWEYQIPVREKNTGDRSPQN